MASPEVKRHASGSVCEVEAGAIDVYEDWRLNWLIAGAGIVALEVTVTITVAITWTALWCTIITGRTFRTAAGGIAPIKPIGFTLLL